MGVGASVARKEDDRFLRGRGQYVADFRIPGLREVAFVRSSVAHARLRGIQFRRSTGTRYSPRGTLPASSRSASATALRGFKHSLEPILAGGKVRYVGEIVAMCVGARARRPRTSRLPSPSTTRSCRQ